MHSSPTEGRNNEPQLLKEQFMAALPSLPETGSDSLLNARQVADRLGLSERWVRDHATRRPPRIPVVKLGPLVRFRLNHKQAPRRPVFKPNGTSAAGGTIHGGLGKPAQGLRNCRPPDKRLLGTIRRQTVPDLPAKSPSP